MRGAIGRRPWLLGVAATLLILLVWQLGSSIGLLDRQLVPPASSVLRRFAAEWGDPEFYTDLVATLQRVLGGFAAAAMIGIPIGLAMGYWTAVRDALHLTIEMVRPVPATALVPVAAVVLGAGTGLHLMIVSIATVVPILLSTVDGVRSVDPVLIGTARTFGKSVGCVFRTVLLPAALPNIMTGLRVAMAIALVVGISSEMIMSFDGLGRRVVAAQRMLQIPDLYAGIMTLAVFGFALNRGLLMAERYLLGWHRTANTKSWQRDGG